MNITYTQKENYLIPNLEMEKMLNKKVKLGKFSKMRLKYLKENRRGMYTMLVARNKLTEHLLQIQEVTIKRMTQIIEKMKKQYGITEELKEKNQIEWIKQMNNIQATAEQMVVREIIYN